ncbi:MAG: multidrug efflux SMR transporter [Anaeromusa sp.]|uniref:DMT family transporter n=1 Tax=Anaeromusa sp. TaxID=1872520 RepID=UPI00262E3362|nr:multidrug efflux SMR transporter [Anaeromusa sp.]MDD3159308.1 multidrug efflux SMR transporter [Anaeromusa sp.]MEA4834135.1 multidrug efflux SMR transporter [Anaeromusa sp.]NCB75946.1 multidrug efflux SMR transporter [Negativicutes bacterium]
MAWIYLVIAGLFEIGWPLGLKMAQTMEGKQFTGLAIAVIAMGLSGFFLFTAQKDIPMGTAYAVWTGIGAAGTFILGIILYNDPIGILRIASVLLIIAGVIGLKLAH